MGKHSPLPVALRQIVYVNPHKKKGEEEVRISKYQQIVRRESAMKGHAAGDYFYAEICAISVRAKRDSPKILECAKSNCKKQQLL